MTEEYERRREFSRETLARVREGLDSAIKDALPMRYEEARFSVYATGSFGRQEASSGSDLDTFITGTPAGSSIAQNLSGLDQKVLIGRIIETVRNCRLPDLDRDGEFIKFYSSDDLVTNIGLADDEIKNTFTARLLLLLESEPLLWVEAHDCVLEFVINTYWRDYGDYPTSFRPTFLINDILKYWRVLCVDYESKMTQGHDNVEERRQTRRVKNLKLRYNRMMTCFSAIASLCDEFGRSGSVSPQQALAICKASPIERLEQISKGNEASCVKDKVQNLIKMYSSFLELSAKGKEEMIARLESDDEFAEQRRQADEFGQAFFELIQMRAGSTDLFRYLIV